MSKKVNNWVENVLLPDLFKKYQVRDKSYTSIIISYKQALYLGDVLHQECIGGLGRRLSFYKAGRWQGREVLLRQKGQYYFLSFGLTAEEQEQLAKEAEKSELQREMELATRAAERKNAGKNARAWEVLTKKYSAELDNLKTGIKDYEETEPDYPFLSLMYKKLENVNKILDILNK